MRLICLLPCLLLNGCGSINFYLQATGGQLEILSKRTPIASVIDDPKTPSRVAERLNLVRELRAFASQQLGLPDNGSYTSYADLGRPYVVWSVFAAPVDSLELKRWCYPLVGCLSYRGYFSETRAHEVAGQLVDEGWEVFVGGVAAYSTLGWFADPVLNTMLRYEDSRLAEVIFHELVHQWLYIPGATQFNESLAVFYAEIGVDLWVKQRHDAGMLEAVRTSRARDAAFYRLVLDYRDQLTELLASTDATTRPAAKENLQGVLEREYRTFKQRWNGYDGFDSFLERDFNNAKLGSLVLYRDYVPAFQSLFVSSGEDLARFRREVEALAALPAAARRERLLELGAIAYPGANGPDLRKSSQFLGGDVVAHSSNRHSMSW